MHQKIRKRYFMNPTNSGGIFNILSRTIKVLKIKQINYNKMFKILKKYHKSVRDTDIL
jgi:hypothetical protein